MHVTLQTPQGDVSRTSLSKKVFGLSFSLFLCSSIGWDIYPGYTYIWKFPLKEAQMENTIENLLL